MRIAVIISFIGFLALANSISAQENDTIDYWDNQLYIGNKIAYSKQQWRYSGEFQVRLQDNARNLQVYYFEGVATYMPNPHWEISPDFRYSIYPEKLEIRPGLGVIYKQFWEGKHKNQIAHQVKYQADIDNTGFLNNGARYILYHNVVINKKLLITSAAGGLYRWSPKFSGFSFFRVLTGVTLSATDQIAFNFSYFVGAENHVDHWSYIGVPFIQFIIRFDKDLKYVPARSISF